jgi:hypothetical protein
LRDDADRPVGCGARGITHREEHMRYARWGLVAALAVSVLAAGTAGAASNTSVTIKSHTDDGYMDGKVKSSKASCERDRLVTLFWDDPDETRDYEPVANTRSKRTGQWKINAPAPPVPPGQYFAKVKKHGDCGKAKSDKINVPIPAS